MSTFTRLGLLSQTSIGIEFTKSTFGVRRQTTSPHKDRLTPPDDAGYSNEEKRLIILEVLENVIALIQLVKGFADEAKGALPAVRYS